MFLLTLIGSIIAALFALCGVLGGVVFFLDAHQGMDIKVFIVGFLTATSPLFAGCMLFALLEILKELRAMRLTMEAHAPVSPAAPAAKPAATKPKEKAAPKEAPVYFPVRETPQGPRIIRPVETEEQAAEPADKQDELTFFKTR